MFIADKNQIGMDGNIIPSDHFKFNLYCTCCGSSKVRFIPTSYYDDASDNTPIKVTVHMICMNCRNDIEFVIFDRTNKNQNNGDR